MHGSTQIEKGDWGKCCGYLKRSLVDWYLNGRTKKNQSTWF